MDVIRDVIGDSLPDGIVTKAVIDNNFSSERALDELLQRNAHAPPGELTENNYVTMVVTVSTFGIILFCHL